MPVTVLDANGLGQDSDVIAGRHLGGGSRRRRHRDGLQQSRLQSEPPGRDRLRVVEEASCWWPPPATTLSTRRPSPPATAASWVWLRDRCERRPGAYFSNRWPERLHRRARPRDIQTTDIGDASTVINAAPRRPRRSSRRRRAFMKAVDPTLTTRHHRQRPPGAWPIPPAPGPEPATAASTWRARWRTRVRTIQPRGRRAGGRRRPIHVGYLPSGSGSHPKPRPRPVRDGGLWPSGGNPFDKNVSTSGSTGMAPSTTTRWDAADHLLDGRR